MKIKILLLCTLFLSSCAFFQKDSRVDFEPQKESQRNSINLSSEEENVIGRAVAAKILQRFKILNNKELSNYLNEIGHTLVSNSDRIETFAGYSFVIIDTDEVNAMAAPGGYIFISKGLLKLITSEDELAAIVAHEITHVTLKHGLQAIKPENFGGFTEIGGEIVSAFDCSGVSDLVLLAFDKAVNDVVNALLISGYSKDQEFESDAGASIILSRAGYDPNALKKILDILSHAQKTESGWFSTHPSAEERIKRLVITENKTVSPGFNLRQKRFFKIFASLK